MRTQFAATGVLLLASACFGQSSEESKVSGEWQTGNGSGKGAETWVIREKDDAVHISRSRNGAKEMEFDCNTLGRECKAEDSGKHVKVSLWFNGPALVEQETRGSQVLQRQFTPAANGDALELETTMISSAGKPETVRLDRVQSAAQSQ